MEILLKKTKINSPEHINPATDPAKLSKITTIPTKLTNQANDLTNDTKYLPKQQAIKHHLLFQMMSKHHIQIQKILIIQ